MTLHQYLSINHVPSSYHASTEVINERRLKRPLLDFAKLSISDSSSKGMAYSKGTKFSQKIKTKILVFAVLFIVFLFILLFYCCYYIFLVDTIFLLIIISFFLYNFGLMLLDRVIFKTISIFII